MSLNLHKNWPEVVRILGRHHVGLGDGLGDAASVSRGSGGEKKVKKKLEDAGYTVASYKNSQTQGDVWAIGSHQCKGKKVVSIVLVQVKTSENDSYPFPTSASDALKNLVKDVRNQLQRADGAGELPALRTRLVVSGWFASVYDGVFRYSIQDVKSISSGGAWLDDEPSTQKAIRDDILTTVKEIWGT